MIFSYVNFGTHKNWAKHSFLSSAVQLPQWFHTSILVVGIATTKLYRPRCRFSENHLKCITRWKGRDGVTITIFFLSSFFYLQCWLQNFSSPAQVSTHVALDHQTDSALAQHTQITSTAVLKCDDPSRLGRWRLGYITYQSNIQIWTTRPASYKKSKH